MQERIDIDELLALNPHIDRQMLEAAIELMRVMKQAGINSPGYNLASPYVRRQLRRSESAVDPRAVNLRRHTR